MVPQWIAADTGWPESDTTRGITLFPKVSHVPSFPFDLSLHTITRYSIWRMGRSTIQSMLGCPQALLWLTANVLSLTQCCWVCCYRHCYYCYECCHFLPPNKIGLDWLRDPSFSIQPYRLVVVVMRRLDIRWTVTVTPTIALVVYRNVCWFVIRSSVPHSVTNCIGRWYSYLTGLVLSACLPALLIYYMTRKMTFTLNWIWMLCYVVSFMAYFFTLCVDYYYYYFHHFPYCGDSVASIAARDIWDGKWHST